jgi:hypothetical protein
VDGCAKWTGVRSRRVCGVTGVRSGRVCGVDGCAEWTGSTSVTRCCNLSSDEGAAARGMADCGGDGAPPKLEGRGGGRAPGGEEADPVGGCDSALDMAEGGGRVAAPPVGREEVADCGTPEPGRASTTRVSSRAVVGRRRGGASRRQASAWVGWRAAVGRGACAAHRQPVWAATACRESSWCSARGSMSQEP